MNRKGCGRQEKNDAKKRKNGRRAVQKVVGLEVAGRHKVRRGQGTIGKRQNERG